MDIKVERIGSVVVLACSGSLDADNVALFKKRVAELFDGGSSKFVLDVSKLNFIDSMGLGAMISLLRRTRERSGDVKTCGLAKEVKEIFEITRLNKLFDVCKDVDSAVKKFT